MNVELFAARDLSDYLRYDVPQAQAAIAQRVVAGWLKSNGVPIDSYELVGDVPAEVFSWAVELGAIVHENPGALSSHTTGAETSSWILTRRADIRAEIEAWLARSGGQVALGAPQGSFPAPSTWPDPAVAPRRWPW